MGFSTRSYESIAQGCVPLVIQDEPVSHTSVDQAFEDLLPWDEFSLRLTQADIPRLPQLLAQYPDAKWRALKRNLACVWPRVVWLHPDNEAPGKQLADPATLTANATAMLGGESNLRESDAWHSLIEVMHRRRLRREGREAPQFEWRVPSRACPAPSR